MGNNDASLLLRVAATDPVASSRLLACPVEILRLCLQPLAAKDLRAACLVCRHLQALAAPFLYHSISCRWSTEESPPIDLLLRTILRRPELAAHTRILDLGHNSYGINKDDQLDHFQPTKIAISKDTMAGSISFVEHVNVQHGSDWIRALKDGEVGPHVAVLIAHTPNLECLNLGSVFAAATLFLSHMFRSALCESPGSGLPAFRNLRQIRQGLPENTCGKAIKARTGNLLLPLFFLPAVEGVSGRIESPLGNPFSWPASHSPRASNLTFLSLEEVREGDLGRVLSATPALKRLFWHCVHYQDGSSPNPIDLDQLGLDLSHVRDTLSDLRISGGYVFQPAPPPSLETRGSLHALAGFPSLTNLECPLEFVLGRGNRSTHPLEQILPRGVKYVSFTDGELSDDGPGWSDFEVVEAMRAWIADWETWTPELEELTLSLNLDCEEWPLPAWEQFQIMCEDTGFPYDFS